MNKNIMIINADHDAAQIVKNNLTRPSTNILCVSSMQQRKQHTAFAVDGYAITASFADCKNAVALHHVKQILLSSFANNTAKNSSGDILAIPPEQRDNNSGGSPYVP